MIRLNALPARLALLSFGFALTACGGGGDSADVTVVADATVVTEVNSADTTVESSDISAFNQVRLQK